MNKIPNDETSGDSDSSIAVKEIAKKCRDKREIKYLQKYQGAWEKVAEFKNWIKPSNKGIHFLCNYCDQSYKAGKVEILCHLKSKKHQENASKYDKNQTVLTNNIGFDVKLNIEKKSKRNELRIASFIAEHNLSFCTSNQLVKLIQNLHLEEEVVKKMTCGRTKCKSLIVNVIGEYSLENLLKKMREEKFLIIIYESTDKSSVKALAIVVRLYVDSKAQDNFLTLKKVPQADSNSLYFEIVGFFNKNNIPYKKTYWDLVQMVHQ